MRRKTKVRRDSIYVIRSLGEPGLVKIGFTGRSVPQRMSEGQTFSPHDLEILAEVPGGRNLERAIHDLFKEHHHRGEWYRYAEPLQEFVQFLQDGGSAESYLF